jgi:hypothetical protein
MVGSQEVPRWGLERFYNPLARLAEAVNRYTHYFSGIKWSLETLDWWSFYLSITTS